MALRVQPKPSFSTLPVVIGGSILQMAELTHSSEHTTISKAFQGYQNSARCLDYQTNYRENRRWINNPENFPRSTPTAYYSFIGGLFQEWRTVRRECFKGFPTGRGDRHDWKKLEMGLKLLEEKLRDNESFRWRIGVGDRLGAETISIVRNLLNNLKVYLKVFAEASFFQRSQEIAQSMPQGNLPFHPAALEQAQRQLACRTAAGAKQYQEVHASYQWSLSPARFIQVESLIAEVDDEMDRNLCLLVKEAFSYLDLPVRNLPKTAVAIRSWLNDPSNQAAIDSVEHISLHSIGETGAMTAIPEEIIKFRNLKAVTFFGEKNGNAITDHPALAFLPACLKNYPITRGYPIDITTRITLEQSCFFRSLFLAILSPFIFFWEGLIYFFRNKCSFK